MRNLRLMIAIVFGISLFFLGGVSVAYADDVSVAGGSSVGAAYNETDVFIAPDITVTTSDSIEAATIALENLPSDCTVGYTNIPAGINVTVRSDQKVVNLKGSSTAANYQQALRGIYINVGTTSANVTVDICIGRENSLYFGGKQHYYEFVEGSMTWVEARADAQTKDLYGMTGYLATITSEEENNFITEFCGGRTWIGGSDYEVEGEWRWVTGPEAGTKFWQGKSIYHDPVGYQVGGMYSNWYLNTEKPGDQDKEPNDYNSVEDYLHIFGMIDSPDENYRNNIYQRWNDYGVDSSTDGYIVEWGGMPGDDEIDTNETCYLSISGSAATHTVAFDSRGGSSVDDATDIPSGSKVNEPSEPTRTGYQFGGWYTALDYNTEWDFYNDTVDFDRTLYAKWTANTYTVQFDGNTSDGGSMSNQNFTYGTAQKLTANAYTRTNYAFQGWATTPTGEVEYDDEENVNNLSDVNNDTVTLYAKWREECTITYDLDGGSGSASDQKGAKGSTVTIHNGKDITKDGHILDGWKIPAVAGDIYELGALYELNNIVEAKANWVADSDGDGTSNPDEVAAGTSPSDPSDKPQTGTIKVVVIDENGNPVPDYTLVLNSTPRSEDTGSDGSVVYSGVSLSPHTLSLRNGNSELGSYSVNFRSTGTNSTSNTDTSVTTFVASDFLTLSFNIRFNGSSWILNDPNITVRSNGSGVVNPKTGEENNRILLMFVITTILIAIYLIIRVNHGKKRYQS